VRKYTTKESQMQGAKFGRLIVIKLSHRTAKSHADYWFCKCDCGVLKVVGGAAMRAGKIQSCGCLQREAAASIGGRSLKHGATSGHKKTAEYKCWADMRRRCDTPSQTSYHKYGGRGIRVCERWDTSFENFLADMGTKPTPQHSLDRIDPNGNYEASNCRWATIREQSLNRRNTRFVIFNNVRFPLDEFCRQRGLSPETVWRRLQRGIQIEHAILPGRLTSIERI
jgi:hypothetical protein